MFHSPILPFQQLLRSELFTELGMSGRKTRIEVRPPRAFHPATGYTTPNTNETNAMTLSFSNYPVPVSNLSVSYQH